MSSINYLAATNFRGSIHRLPETTFNLQKSNIPGISGEHISRPTHLSNPLSDTYDKLTYNVLNWTFLVDENMKNYIEIVNWMHGVGFPQDFSQFKKEKKENGLISDISLIILNNSKNPIKQFVFHNAFPISLSDLDFDTTVKNYQFIEAKVTFTYDYYTIEEI